MPASSFVFPVRYVTEGTSVQSTSRELSALGLSVRSLAPPHVGARVAVALYLPNAAAPEVAIARVARSKANAAAEAGFWADFLVLEPEARLRISSLVSLHAQGGQHRAFPRVAARLPLKVGNVETELVNLSRSGIFVSSSAPPAVNSSVDVELQLPDAAVATRGIVVHRQEAGFGIQFVDATDDFRERIDRYLQA